MSSLSIAPDLLQFTGDIILAYLERPIEAKAWVWGDDARIQWKLSEDSASPQKLKPLFKQYIGHPSITDENLEKSFTVSIEVDNPELRSLMSTLLTNRLPSCLLENKKNGDPLRFTLDGKQVNLLIDQNSARGASPKGRFEDVLGKLHQALSTTMETTGYWSSVTSRNPAPKITVNGVKTDALPADLAKLESMIKTQSARPITDPTRKAFDEERELHTMQFEALGACDQESILCYIDHAGGRIAIITRNAHRDVHSFSTYRLPLDLFPDEKPAKATIQSVSISLDKLGWGTLSIRTKK